MNPRKLKYIVFAPTYSETSGGAIFLHAFAQEFHALGETVLFEPRWPRGRDGMRWFGRRWLRRRRFKSMPGSNVAMASGSDLKDPNAVVIYPEGELGNPTEIANVVRWLIYRPGVLAPFEFTTGEMVFKLARFQTSLRLLEARQTCSSGS